MGLFLNFYKNAVSLSVLYIFDLSFRRCSKSSLTDKPMNLICWQSIHTLNALTKLMQDSLTKFLEDCQQSTIWIGNTEETAIRKIAIKESKTELVLEVLIPDVDSQSLDIQVSQETVLIRGKWTKKAEVEGYFHPSEFQSLIPLPDPVHPERNWAELNHDILRIRLLKLTAIQQSRIQIKLDSPNLTYQRVNQEEKQRVNL